MTFDFYEYKNSPDSTIILDLVAADDIFVI